MQAFSRLIDALVYTGSRNAKLKLISDYLRVTPDPDRGWALAALTGGLDFPAVKSATIRNLMTERVDPVLYALSRDYVGDTAETASLLWPEPAAVPEAEPSLDDAVQALRGMTRNSVQSELPRLLDRLDANGRFAIIKLATGAMRIGISARLAKLAFAQAFDVAIEDVEEYWHGQEPPYSPLFDWAANGGEAPSGEHVPLFRPFMLAHPLDDAKVDLADFAAEWKWDGIRVQLVRAGDETRLYSRSGENISHTFPEIAQALGIPAVLDGELLVRGSHQGGEVGGAASFNALQQRLVSRKMLEERLAGARHSGRARWRTAGARITPGRRSGRCRQFQRLATAAGAQDRLQEDAGRLSRIRGCTICCCSTAKTCAPCPGANAASGSKRSCPGSTATVSTFPA